jgi:hypothetical protein
MKSKQQKKKSSSEYIHKGFKNTPIGDVQYGSQFFRSWATINPDVTVKKEALERAWHNRDFEIEMYWKRATYFWTFIGATLVGYFAIYSSKVIEKFYQSEFLIICFGFFLSIIWLLANQGSKFWQKNWEYHIDMLEDNVTGPLYKTVRRGEKYSVSRLNSLMNIATIFVWIILGIHYYFANKLYQTPPNFIWYKNADWYSWSCLIVTVVLTIIAFMTKTRTSDTEYTGFAIRERIPNTSH